MRVDKPTLMPWNENNTNCVLFEEHEQQDGQKNKVVLKLQVQQSKFRGYKVYKFTSLSLTFSQVV